MHFDLTSNDDWLNIKLLIYCNKVCYNKQCIKYDTYRNSMKVVFNKIEIFSTHFLHFGRGIGPI